MTADQLVRQAITAAVPELTPEQIEQTLQGWTVYPFIQKGELVGAACIKGSEFHCMTEPGFRLNRKEMREWLRPHFEKFGFLTTRVAHDDIANQRFNALFGFERTWSDGTFHYYLMANLPFGKEKTCQL